MSPSGIIENRDSRLARRLGALGVRECDLQETFVRSGGPGGQNLNKTSTCVVLLHRPTGLWVKCQESRQQGMNRLRARELLATRLETRAQTRVAAALAAREKLRRQKLGRSAAARQRLLEEKAWRATKKSFRRRPIEE